jgi:hypothetical protein
MFWQFFGCGSWPGKQWRRWLKGGTKGGWGGGGRRTWREDPDWLFYCINLSLVWHLFILYSFLGLQQPAAALPEGEGELPELDTGPLLHVTPRPHTGHGRHRYQGIFYFFFRTRNGRWLGGQFFGAGSRTISGAGSETIFVLYFSLLHTKKRLHYRGEGGSVKVKTIIFYVTPPIHFLFLSLVCPTPLSYPFPIPTSVADSGCLSRVKQNSILSYEVIKKILVNFQRIIELFV